MTYNFDAALKSGLTPQEITNYLYSKGRGQEADSYFKVATTPKEKGALLTANAGRESSLTTAGKAAVNVVPDFIKTTLNFPIDTAKTVAQIPGQIGGLIKDSGGIVPAIKNFLSSVTDTKPYIDTLKTIVPSAAQKIVKGDFTGAANDIANHPFQQIAPFLVLLEGGIKGTTGFEPVSATGKAVLGPVGDVFQGAKAGGSQLGGAISDTAKTIANKAEDVVTPIDKGVQTVLNNPEVPKTTMAQKLDRYTAQAEKAVEDYSQPTPLELAGKEAEKALGKITQQLKEIGTQKKEITKGLAQTDTGNIVSDARQEIRTGLEDRVGIRFTKGGNLRNAAGRESAISDPTDLKLLKAVDQKLANVEKRPTFQRVDDAIDYVQDALYKRKQIGTVPVNGKIEGLLKQTVKNLNGKLKTIGGEDYQQANAQYSKYVGIRDILNKALGIDANKGAALMKQLFSPAGTAPRKLFAAVKQLTGIDLVQEATLAKFAMENIGDVRQASLLEQVLKGHVTPSTSGIIKTAAEKILNKVQNPVSKAKRMVQSRKD